jgi:hypothetical protein
MYAVITLDPNTLEEREPILTNNVQYIDNDIRVYITEMERDDYAPCLLIPKEQVVLVKKVSITQLNEAIKSL